jgi:hypothetical protein
MRFPRQRIQLESDVDGLDDHESPSLIRLHLWHECESPQAAAKWPRPPDRRPGARLGQKTSAGIHNPQLVEQLTSIVLQNLILHCKFVLVTKLP